MKNVVNIEKYKGKKGELRKRSEERVRKDEEKKKVFERILLKILCFTTELIEINGD